MSWQSLLLRNLVITADKALIARGHLSRNNVFYESLAGMRRTAGIDACGTLI
jgi:hypothetical protein